VIGKEGIMARKGFTIIELIMVIVVISILAVLAVPRFDSFNEIKLRGAAHKLVSDIRYAQMLATSKHEDYGVEFDADNDRYRVYCVSTDLPAVDPFTRLAGTATWSGGLIIDYAVDSEYKGIDLASVDFNGGDELLFTSLGVPQDTDGDDLTEAGTVSIGYEASGETIEVTPNTGKITLQ